MAAPVIMPKQGQSVETCIITEWYKKKGEEIKKGDMLFGYETDKASFEEEAKEEGILLEVFFHDGDEVPVLTNVAVIGKKGESVDQFRPTDKTDEKSDTKSKDEEKPEQKENEPEIPLTKKREPTDTDIVFISPRAKKLAEKKKIPYSHLAGSGPDGRIIARDIQHAEKNAAKLTASAYDMAKDTGMTDTGKGLGGRVMMSDLHTTPVASGNDFEIKKISNIRKLIANSMFQSLSNSAQLTHHTTADARKILAFRKIVKISSNKGKKPNITLNDIICYTVIQALIRHPNMNSHFLGDTIKEFNKVHLGIAVDTPRGLMVPVVRNASDLTLENLSVEIKSLVEQCKKGNIDPELLASEAASFTVTNLGSFGIEMFTPVLNLPQVGILGINTTIQRPADIGGGVIGMIPLLGLSLTYDHRANDGVPASKFLLAVKQEVEKFSYSL